VATREVICKGCGKKFRAPASKPNKCFCSRECRSNYPMVLALGKYIPPRTAGTLVEGKRQLIIKAAC
jgi:hypothetical protein